MKIGICGHFGIGRKFFDGQTIKTKILENALKQKFGSDEIYIVDTYNWKKNPVKLLIECFRLMHKCENIIILPSINGVKIFARVFGHLNKFYNRNLYYFVIGSRLDKAIHESNKLIKPLAKFTKIYVETKVLENKLKKYGLRNVEILLNFKDIKILDKPKNVRHNSPLKICTFSRVTPLKGIKEAIATVIKINEKHNKQVYTLDIYGQIEPLFVNEFNRIIDDSPDYISYKGIIDYNNTSEVLKDYFLLLFPTKYFNEGIPGTIIDAYAAGVPVVASNWESANEVVKNKITGYIYDFNDSEELEQVLNLISKKPEKILPMRNNCIKEAKKYSTKNALSNFFMEL